MTIHFTTATTPKTVGEPIPVIIEEGASKRQIMVVVDAIIDHGVWSECVLANGQIIKTLN